MAAKKGVCKKWSKSGKRRCLKRNKSKRRPSRGYRRASSKRRSTRRGYRRGHRPYNKGKRCRAYAVNKRGIRVCASYGSKRNKRHKSRVFGPSMPPRGMGWSYDLPTAGGSMEGLRYRRARARARMRAVRRY